MKPETPLPWNEIPGYDWPGEFESYGSRELSEEDIPYILHACNAYPKLVALLEDIRISGTAYSEHADELLKELGEI